MPDAVLVITSTLSAALSVAEHVDAAVLDVLLPDNDSVEGLQPLIDILDNNAAPWVIYSICEGVPGVSKGQLLTLIREIKAWQKSLACND